MKNCPAQNVNSVASSWPPPSLNQYTPALKSMGMNAQEVLLLYLGAKVNIYIDFKT